MTENSQLALCGSTTTGHLTGNYNILKKCICQGTYSVIYHKIQRLIQHTTPACAAT